MASDPYAIWYQRTAHAKVNLCLNVLGRRTDGYHNLSSFAAFTAFGDTLYMRKSTSDRITLEGPFAPDLQAAGGDHLCRSVLNHLRQAGYAVPPLDLKLEKHIPLGGGLGGGSSDAAALLRLISEHILKTPIADTDMVALGAQIGADVPVCLYPGWQIMSGTGTHIEPVFLPDAKQQSERPIYCVLANPGLAVSTASIFSSLSQFSAPADDALMDAIEDGDLKAIIDRGNDLTEPACAQSSEIRVLIEKMAIDHEGFIGANMTGSGASCFALSYQLSFAQELASDLARSGYWAITTTLLNRPKTQR